MSDGARARSLDKAGRARRSGRTALAFGALAAASAVGVAALVPNMAEGRQWRYGSILQGGKRNPFRGNFSKETSIFVNNPQAYAARYSNGSKEGGGGQFSACRAPVGQEACIKINQKGTATAFWFKTKGTVGGRISTSGANAVPFSLTKNTTGLVTHLNADMVDGVHTSNLLQTTASVTKTEDLVPAAQLLWAIVKTDGTLSQGRNAASSARSAVGSFSVTFNAEVDKCSYTATIDPAGTPATPTGQATVTASATDKKVVGVSTYDVAGAAADRQFHLQVMC